VLVNKRAYANAGGGGPRRGDVIVFRDARAEAGGQARLVKRVIGVAGDVVAFNNG
jgi:signal peptidase I